jgi:serine/threonine-protein kinase
MSEGEDERLWDSALRRAFEEEREEKGDSVLARLEARGDEPVRVLLREAIEEAETAIVRPRPEEGASPGPAGRYQVVGEIARGGVGVVLKARDADLGRDVAMKVLAEEHEGKGSLIPRFVEEAQIGGQLQHPGIVPVYELGLLDRERPYFTMKLVRGRTLSEILAERRDVGEERRRFLRIFEQVCQTIAYAHSRGVIHRDLKPANVMVGSFGEVQVIDWGFAKVLTRGGVADEVRARGEEEVATVRSGPDGSASVSGSALGTPAYMAPEQALGNLEAIDERTDVFCLGGILTEILTGSPPHTGADRKGLLLAAGRGDLGEAHARFDRCGADPELIDLAMRCLAVAKAERPRDAGELAEQVSAHLSSLAERARAAELTAVEERARAVHERRAKRLAIGLGVFVVLALLVGGSVVLAHRARLRSDREETAREIAAILAGAEVLADGDEWERAVEEVVRAETRLHAAKAFPEDEALVEERLSEYRRRAQEHALLSRIEAVRLREDLDMRRTPEAYAEAFRDYGIDVMALGDAEIEARIRAAGTEAAEVLCRALDDWVSRHQVEPDLARKLIAAANLVDEDPWRQKLRLAILNDDRKLLDALADSLAHTPRPPESVILLAHAIRGPPEEGGDAETAVAVLLRGYESGPGDFWISFRIGMGFAMLGAGEPEVGVLHARIAVALRPRSPQVRAALALAILRRAKGDAARPGDFAEARAAVDWALERSPDDTLARVALAVSLAAGGEMERARAIVEEALEGHPRPERARRIIEEVLR